MRDVRVDLAGTTDANGNATIKVPLPFTGAWYDLKFPLGLPSAAEWAVLVSGTPLTYGRGRRVTLGPELIRDGETVTISVTGGPVNAPIVGSANGKAGTPDEILAGFTMSPNTIALDAATPEINIGRLDAAQALATVKDLPLPPGTLAVGFVVNLDGANVTPFQILIQGNVTKQFYMQAATFPSGQGVQAALVSVSDTSVRCSVSAPAGGPSSATFLAFLSIPPVSSLNSLPAVWQAPTNNIETASGNAGGTPLLAGLPGKVVRIFGCGVEIENAAAPRFVALQSSATATRFCYMFASSGAQNAFLGGVPLPVGEGVNIVTGTLAGELFRGYIGYSQG